MSEGSRSKNINQSLKEFFSDRWKEDFIIDALSNRKISYKIFFSAIVNAQKRLKDLGLRKDDKVCVLVNNSVDLITLYFACLLLQSIVVPIDPQKGKAEIEEILSQVDYKAIIHDQDNNVFSKGIKIKKICNDLSARDQRDVSELDIFDDIDYNKLFLLTFTSGSTGPAKGVMHSFSNLFYSATAFQEQFNFGKENIFYHNLPMAYMAGILNLVILPFVAGSKIVLGERFNISNLANFWDVPVEYSVNTFWFIPTILSLLLKLDRGGRGVAYAKQSKIVGCVGTAPLSPRIKKDFQEKYNIQLYNSYGLSEALFVTTQSPNVEEGEETVGKPLIGIEISLAQDNEIMIQAPWMFLGYYNAETEDCFEQGKFKSGDIGRIDKNDYLTITDRKKDLIIKGGINISPKKIDGLIGRFNVISEYAIVGVPDDIVGEKIVCCFVDEDELFAKEQRKEINRQIIALLGKSYQIDEFFQMDKLPINVNGKIDKMRIRRMYQKNDYSN